MEADTPSARTRSVPAVSRNYFLWVLVLFFGCSLLFGALRRLTEDESSGVVVGVQLGALVLILGAVVVVFRRLR